MLKQRSNKITFVLCFGSRMSNTIFSAMLEIGSVGRACRTCVFLSESKMKTEKIVKVTTQGWQQRVQCVWLTSYRVIRMAGTGVMVRHKINLIIFSPCAASQEAKRSSFVAGSFVFTYGIGPSIVIIIHLHCENNLSITMEYFGYILCQRWYRCRVLCFFCAAAFRSAGPRDYFQN